MPQRVRLLLATALPPLLVGVWATFLVLVGAAPAAGGVTVISSASAAPAVPARTDGPQRTASVRPEVRRAPVAVVQQAVATDADSRPPVSPVAAGTPAAFDFQQPPAGDPWAGPRQERAPPQPPYSPRNSRAPPTASSS
ncbi:hypothetical protein ACWF94_24105 [Streptomyces sp. NPDC055078]